MNTEEIRAYCLLKKAVTEGFPFDDETLVFKVGGKIFALLAIENGRINLKCDPEKAIELREQYEAMLPGYHMNKHHWNTLIANELPSKLIAELIDHSYGLVLKSLPRKIQQEINEL
jgi:predicted DNA-binding protein (MmcQ/YjbR family)